MNPTTGQLKRIFGCIPTNPKGKKLTEILWLRVCYGETSLDPTYSQWRERSSINMSQDKVPVAIFALIYWCMKNFNWEKV